MQLFINKGYRLIYALPYILFALIYPISQFISEGEFGLAVSVFSAVANYILPFYLYLFLFILSYDILLLINLIFRFIPVTKLKTTKYRKTVLTLIISLSVIVVVCGIINFNTIRTSEYRIEVPGRSSDIKSLRIVFAADFHLQESTSVRFVEKFVARVEELKPDLMLFGGDIVEGDREDENLSHIENLISEIRTKYGVFTVLGNHEYYAGQDKGSFFGNSGIKVLCDTIIVIDNSFSLGGRYDSHFKKRKAIGDLVKPVTDSLPFILLDHRPTEVDQISKTKVDIQLSGHTHNGQLFPINLITNHIYELSYGYLKKGNTHFFVTSGICLWGPPVRTAGKSEIMVIDINFKH
jgi:predicted MPP superfamily phosphohydrolase